MKTGAWCSGNPGNSCAAMPVFSNKASVLPRAWKSKNLVDSSSIEPNLKSRYAEKFPDV
uniref:Uncharacterized protein n=1 Tax=Anguilla anguilla TaxID=7936 RepID=A0A0E9WLK9_ANGAN